jgi:flagellar hook-length control protein FliK
MLPSKKSDQAIVEENAAESDEDSAAVVVVEVRGNGVQQEQTIPIHGESTSASFSVPASDELKGSVENSAVVENASLPVNSEQLEVDAPRVRVGVTQTATTLPDGTEQVPTIAPGTEESATEARLSEQETEIGIAPGESSEQAPEPVERHTAESGADAGPTHLMAEGTDATSSSGDVAETYGPDNRQRDALSSTDVHEKTDATESGHPELDAGAEPRTAATMGQATTSSRFLAAVNVSLSEMNGSPEIVKPESEEAAAKKTSQSDALRTDGLLASFGRLQRGGVAARGDRTSDADSVPRVDAARFVVRVSKAFQSAQEQGGTIHLRLSPPELGTLRLELTVRDGGMIASLETESNTTRKVLLDHLPALRERLAEQHIRIERFDVDVRRDGGNGQPNPGPQEQHQQHSQNPATSRHHSRLAKREEPVPSGMPVSPIAGNSELNLLA